MEREHSILFCGIMATVMFLVAVFVIDTCDINDSAIRRSLTGISEVVFFIAALHFREKIDLLPERKRELILIVPAYIGILCIGLCISPLLGVDEIREFLDASFIARCFLLVVNFVCIAPSEELYFRGILQKEYGIIITTMWFMILHPYDMWIQSAIASVILGYLRMKVGVLSAIMAHAFYNATLIILSFLI